MSWLSRLFSTGSSTNTQLVMKYSRDENQWLVMNGYDILYIGSEPQCNAFMWNFISK